MYIRIIEPDFIFRDERGQLTQLVHEGYQQVNYILSYAGENRGGHYHRYNRELFYVISGSLELAVWPAERNDTMGTECYTFCTRDMFEIPENMMHSFRFLEETSLISMYSNGVELASGEKDIIKGDLNEDCNHGRRKGNANCFREFRSAKAYDPYFWKAYFTASD